MTNEILPSDGIKKKRVNFEKNLLENMAIKKKLKKKILFSKKADYIRADLYIKEYKKKVQYNIDQMRISRIERKFYVPIHAKTFFIIRIRGINDIPPQAKKILELFRLNRINSGVFLKINSSTVKMIKKIEPYIAYGYPSLRSINMLLKKRGYGKIGKRGSWQRIFLSDDRIIKTALSIVGIHSLEDIIQELFTGGSRFKEVNNFLWPFKLKSPKRGYSKIGKRRHVSEGGVFGNWEESINELIYKMS
jgi:large subunit ribosomal protein L7e